MTTNIRVQTGDSARVKARSPISRRNLVKGTGALVVWFSLSACAGPSPSAKPTVASAPGTPPAPPTAPTQTPVHVVPTVVPQFRAAGAGTALDSWLAIDQDSKVTAFSGKVELGTGVQTALAQIVADELAVPFANVTMIMGDTNRTPNEGYTAGSQTIQVGGAALRDAAAEARRFLLDLAAKQFAVAAAQLTVKAGVISVHGNAGKTVSYGALLGGKHFNQVVPDKVQTESPGAYTVVGKSIPRVDLPGKLTGPWPYVQNLRIPGMLHGRVIHPAGIGATLESVDESTVQGLPGLVKVVRNGNFLGVVAEREEQAIALAQTLKATWKLASNLPKQSDLATFLKTQSTQDKTVLAIGDAAAAINGTEQSLSATYFWPYQAHASIGPSCAVADVKTDSATIWSSTQGVFPLRGALAQLLGMPSDNVRVIHQEGAGCYGHNGFDDVAADAALLSKEVGKPVRVQWMRADEFIWEPKGPPMVIEVRGGLDQHGNVLGWDYGVWTPTHSTRPGGMAGNLLAGQLTQPPAPPAKNGFAGGDRNAPTNYDFKNNHVVVHWVKDSPLRPSALRSLGGAANSFANESFMDELAATAKVDPIEFRLRHLADPRAIAVIKEAAKLAHWQSRPSPRTRNGSGVTTGRGISFMQYENHLTYVAVVAEVQVDQSTGQTRVQRLSVAHDCGLIINPDGLRNQIEGNCIQATSRALKEQVNFSPSTVTSVDWETYPILTFPEVPDVQISLIDHPDQPAWGIGEATTENIAPAIANAIFDATGARVRSVPFSAAQVKAALGG